MGEMRNPDGGPSSPQWATKGRRPMVRGRRGSALSQQSTFSRYSGWSSMGGRSGRGANMEVDSQYTDVEHGREIPDGSLVEAHSLKHAVGYNGLWGTVVSTERTLDGVAYSVRFRPPHGVKRLLAANVRLVRSSRDMAASSHLGTSCLKGRQGMTKARIGVKYARHLAGRRREFIALVRGPIDGGECSDAWGDAVRQAESIALVIAFWLARDAGKARKSPVLTFDRRHEVVSSLPDGAITCEEVDAQDFEKMHAMEWSATRAATGPGGASQNSQNGPGLSLGGPLAVSGSSRHSPAASPVGQAPATPTGGSDHGPYGGSCRSSTTVDSMSPYGDQAHPAARKVSTLHDVDSVPTPKAPRRATRRERKAEEGGCDCCLIS
eukprot:TRINITY_DN13466_c0_g1_i1.p1 TRINITY_DN13466_c0_g1~~TRINITY_DN13466_c0_g1_i1.p1  ORF type:complete len:379 (+),score=31.21 TRINITY_DN13466_c0_g1_i1:148-1284(+)